MDHNYGDPYTVLHFTSPAQEIRMFFVPAHQKKLNLFQILVDTEFGHVFSVIGDTYMAIDGWVAQPQGQSHTTLDDILLCADAAVTAEARWWSKEVNYQLVTKLNQLLIGAGCGRRRGHVGVGCGGRASGQARGAAGGSGELGRGAAGGPWVGMKTVGNGIYSVISFLVVFL
jgi:hypothetical protein